MKTQPFTQSHWLAILEVLAALAIAGCTTTAPPVKGRPDLLEFLADGQTTKTEAITTLGEPSGRFEHEKILTYRLGFEPQNQGYYIVGREAASSGWPTWATADFSLVLIFDDTGMLRKHSLVKVNK